MPIVFARTTLTKGGNDTVCNTREPCFHKISTTEITSARIREKPNQTKYTYLLQYVLRLLSIVYAKQRIPVFNHHLYYKSQVLKLRSQIQ